MSILIGRDTRLVVQGITGREGEFHSRAMLEYGTHVVAGMTPGKGGQMALDGRVPGLRHRRGGRPRDRREHLLHLRPGRRRPGRGARGGRTPASRRSSASPRASRLWTCSRVVEVVRRAGARLIGPNCPGATSPGQAKVGSSRASIHREGRVGVVSRSGTLTYEAVQAMTDAGIGQSTCVGIGGDPIIGTHVPRRPPAVRGDDPETEAIVLIGEIGGAAEEEAAAWAAEHLRGVPMVGVHRRPDGARGQAHGPRRRDHLRRQRAPRPTKVAALEAAGIRVRAPPDRAPGAPARRGLSRLRAPRRSGRKRPVGIPRAARDAA